MIYVAAFWCGEIVRRQQFVTDDETVPDILRAAVNAIEMWDVIEISDYWGRVIWRGEP